MMKKPETYPAFYIIFTLLNAIRRGIERRNISREFRRQRIALQPRLSFWVALCQEAGLIKMENELRVASYARTWLKKTAEEQAFDLIEAWQNAPKNRRVRQFRKNLLWKLKYDKTLTAKDQGALNGLAALGLVDNILLTKWGEIIVKGKGSPPLPSANRLCVIHDNHFFAPLLQHPDLLWDLETYLQPTTPGVYPLTKRGLQFYNGDPYRLIELIERGIQKSIPDQLKGLILKQPSIRVTDGIVLEFSTPTALKQLRRQPVFRKYMDEFLSSQRILVSFEKAKGLVKMLKRRGVFVDPSKRLDSLKVKRTHFCATSKPRNPSNPVGKKIPKLSVIKKYQALGQALEILYRAPGCSIEHRRITPLLIEDRGEYMYVIAYCQTQRAQRTFRLDRMEVPGAY